MLIDEIQYDTAGYSAETIIPNKNRKQVYQIYPSTYTVTDGTSSTAAKITVNAGDSANIVIGNKYTTIEGLNTSIYVRSIYLNADL